MNRKFARVMGIVLAAVAAFALSLSLTACQEKIVLSLNTADDGSRVITADGCDGDGYTYAGFTQEAGASQIVISSELEKGALNIQIIDQAELDAPEENSDAETIPSASGTDVADALGEGPVLVEFDATGVAEEVFQLEPGDYGLKVTGSNDAPATGTVTITPR